MRPKGLTKGKRLILKVLVKGNTKEKYFGKPAGNTTRELHDNVLTREEEGLNGGFFYTLRKTFMQLCTCFFCKA